MIVSIPWLLGVVFVFLGASQISTYFQAHIRLKPSGIPVEGFSHPLLKWISSIYYFLRCEPVAQNAYDKGRGSVFAIPTLWNYHVCISDSARMKDFNRAPPNQLSFNEFLEDAIFPGYTINGFHFDPADPRSKLSVRALMGGLRAHLPALKPKLHKLAASIIDEQVSDSHNVKRGKNGWSHINAKRLGHLIAGNMISLVVLGEKLSSSKENVNTAIQYAWDAMLTSQILASLPHFLHPYIGPYLMRRTGACKRLQRLVYAETQLRIRQRAGEVQPSPEKPLDCVQWMLDAVPENSDATAHEVTQRALGMIFAGMFQPEMFMTYSLYNLNEHEEYLEPLRSATSTLNDETLYTTHLPLLDSYLKEVARLNPLRAVSIDRKVMSDFTFSDGTVVKAGNDICVPQQAILIDPEIYAEPKKFDPRRFMNVDTRFTHPSQAFPFWGAVSRPCPARFYVSTIVKLSLIHIIRTYDIELAQNYRSSSISWGPNVVPHPQIAFLFKKRSIAV